MDHDSRGNGLPAVWRFVLEYDAWGRLVLTEADGRRYVGAEPVRAFPVSDPERGLSILDAEGHEIAWVDDLAQLPPAVRRFLEEDLARREFVPVLRRIVRISAPIEPSDWDVETDRGPTRFTLNNEDDVRALGDHRAMIVDAHGTRYLIPDTRALDGTSRRLLERFL